MIFAPFIWIPPEPLELDSGEFLVQLIIPGNLELFTNPVLELASGNWCFWEVGRISFKTKRLVKSDEIKIIKSKGSIYIEALPKSYHNNIFNDNKVNIIDIIIFERNVYLWKNIILMLN